MTCETGTLQAPSHVVGFWKDEIAGFGVGAARTKIQEKTRDAIRQGHNTKIQRPVTESASLRFSANSFLPAAQVITSETDVIISSRSKA